MQKRIRKKQEQMEAHVRRAWSSDLTLKQAISAQTVGARHCSFNGRRRFPPGVLAERASLVIQKIIPLRHVSSLECFGRSSLLRGRFIHFCWAST